MINVHRNENFTQWYNVVLNGKLIDNAMSYAKAMAIAKRLSKAKGVGILSCKWLYTKALGQIAPPAFA